MSSSSSWKIDLYRGIGLHTREKSACVKNGERKQPNLKKGKESIEVKSPEIQNHAECFVFVVPVVRPEVPQEGKPDSAAVEDVSPLRTTMSEHSGPERGRLPGRPTE